MNSEMNLEDEVEESVKVTDEKYSNEVLQHLNNLRKQGTMCDLVLRVDRKDFPVHRNVMAACSDYFKAMFNSNMKESTEKRIEIRDMSDAATMTSILNFIYTGTANLNRDNVKDILHVANFMLISSVKEACCRFLKGNLDRENCVEILTIAETYACDDLSEYCTDFIHKHFYGVLHTEAFLTTPCNLLAEWLKSDDIRVENEEEVYDALLRWLNHDIEKRRMFFPELIKLVRLPLLSKQYFEENVEGEELFETFESCKCLLEEARDYHSALTRGTHSARTRKRNYERLSETLIAVGGNGEIHRNTTAFGFNITKNEWSDMPVLPQPRGYHGMAAVGGSLFVIGGLLHAESALASVLRYDAKNKAWNSCAHMRVARCKPGVTECNGLIYSLGGFDGTTTLAVAECYNPMTNRWKMLTPMPVTRRCATAVSYGIYVYIVGGHDGSNILETVDRYDTLRGRWDEEAVQPMSTRRSFPCAVVNGDHMYVIGGYDGTDTLRTCEAYSFSTQQWAPIPPMDAPRSNAGAAVMNNKIYVVGGWDGIGLSSVEAFDIMTQTWASLPNLPRQTTGVRCCFLRYEADKEVVPKRKLSRRAKTCTVF